MYLLLFVFHVNVLFLFLFMCQVNFLMLVSDGADAQCYCSESFTVISNMSVSDAVDYSEL